MEDIELRLARLESVNLRYRLYLTVCVALLAVISLAGFGQVGQNQQQTFPRNIVADSISVTSLNAVSGVITQLGTNNATVQYMTLADGRAEGLTIKMANLGTMQAQQAALGRATASQIDVKAANGGGITLNSSSDSGAVTVTNQSGRPVAFMGGDDGAGLIRLNGRAGFVGLEGGVDEKGGRFKIYNSANRQLASITRADRGDGEIATYNDSGNRLVILKSDDDMKSGKVIVQREGAFPMVTLTADDKGGLVKTHDEKKETARIPAKAD